VRLEYYLSNSLTIPQGMGEVEAVHTFEFDSMHYFSPEWSKWIAVEALFASDTCVDDYYTRGHVKNRGTLVALEASKLLFERTELIRLCRKDYRIRTRRV
jgi:hypothetical protein